jgi:putative transposase
VADEYSRDAGQRAPRTRGQEALLEAAAARTYEAPDGRRVRFTWRTLEGWYYQYSRGGLTALESQPRSDTGTCRAIPEAVAKHILALRREVPRRSVRVLIRAVERAKLVASGHARQVERGPPAARARAVARPRATPERERRAFTVELPGDLWMGDAMHGPPVFDRDGVLRKKAYLLTQIDVASRFLINSDFYLHEAAEYQEDGLRRAITGHGIPREYYVDLGAAYIAIRCGRSAPSSVSTCSTLARGRRRERCDRALSQDLARRGRHRAAEHAAADRRAQ